MSELKFEVTIPEAQFESIVKEILFKGLGLSFSVPGITVNLKENFVPSHGSSGPTTLALQEEIKCEKDEETKTMTDILKESMTELSKATKETHKVHWAKQLEKSLLTKLIAFKCDCGHTIWRLCKDGNFDCECNNCGKVHKWDVLELYRLDYSCKCGYKKYLYMPLSHQIVNLRCGDCKSPVDIRFNSKMKRFEQIK